MKNTLKIFIAVFVFSIGIFNSQAQQRPEEIAKDKVAQLEASMTITGDQQRALWRSFVKSESSLARQVVGENQNDPTVIKAKNEIKEQLNSEVRSILTTEQYEQYLKMF